MDMDALLAEIPPDPWHRRLRHRVRRLYPRALMREIKWGVQRWRRGYSDRDVWGLDSHLARVISGGVRQLITELHGHPGEMTFEEWQAILAKIAAGFEAHMTLHEEYPDEDRGAELERQWEEGSRLFLEWFAGLWD
jgi:hypothetical protein